MEEWVNRLADVRWAGQVWWRDPRFPYLLPHSDATVDETCRHGSLEEQQLLWANRAEIDTRRQRLETVPLPEAVAAYVAAISGQHGVRLQVLLAYTSLRGQNPIRGKEAVEFPPLAGHGCYAARVSVV